MTVPPSCPVVGRGVVGLSTSQMNTDPRRVPVASRRPSGDRASDRTANLCSNAGPSSCRVFTSHWRTNPSSLAVNSRVPSGLNATAQTGDLYLRLSSTPRMWPSATSQNLTAPPSVAVAISSPHGSNATDQMAPSPDGRVNFAGVSDSAAGAAEASAIRSGPRPRWPRTVHAVSPVASAATASSSTAAAEASIHGLFRRHHGRTYRGPTDSSAGSGPTSAGRAGAWPASAVRASAASAASGNRSRGSFAISRSRTSASEWGTAGLYSWTGRGRLSVTCLSTVNGDVPGKGGPPASIAYRTLPRLNRSAR